MKKFLFFALFFLLMVASTANASPITFQEVTGHGRYWTDWMGERIEGGSLNILTDGYIPLRGSPWYQDTVNFGPRFTSAVYPDEDYTPVVFVFDIGSLYYIEDIVIAVDNNDNYDIVYSTDAISWYSLAQIDRSYGIVDEFEQGGIDIFATNPNSPYYEPLISFSPVVAQYLAIYASGHDYGYAIGEFQAFGTPVLPSEQVEIILDFIEDSIEDGTLEGLGEGHSAGNRVNALINMIISAGNLLEDGQIINGCQQLADIYLKVDGISPPPDFVTGEAREELADRIDGMMFYYGCE